MNEKSENSITLSFHGVDFSLIPGSVGTGAHPNNLKHKENVNGVSMVSNSKGEFNQLNLSSFTGTIQVSLSPSSPPVLAHDANNNRTPSNENVFTMPTPHVSPTTFLPNAVDCDDDYSGDNKQGNIESENEQKSSSIKEFLKVKRKRGIPKKKKGQGKSSISSKKACIKGNILTDSLAGKTTNVTAEEFSTLDASQPIIDTTFKDPIYTDALYALSPDLGQPTPISSQSSNQFPEVLNGSAENGIKMKEMFTSNPKLESLSFSSIKEIIERSEKDDDENHAGSMAEDVDTNNKDQCKKKDLEMNIDSMQEDFDTHINNLIMESETGNHSQIVDNELTIESSSSVINQPQTKIDCLPCHRWGQTMTFIDHYRLLVYGGQFYDTKEDILKTIPDVYLYDMTKQAWSKPINCESVPRTWHTSTFLPDRQLLISFGGESFNPKTKKTTTTDQVMVLDTEIMLWYPPSVSGEVPVGRSGHSASLVPNTNELVVFGGVRNSKWMKTVAVLDTARWKWSVPTIRGKPPCSRAYHTATPVSYAGGNMLVIFGGNNDLTSINSVHVLDTTNTDGKGWSWSEKKIAGTPPSPRTGHSATLLEDGKTILVYGGWDPCEDDEQHGADDTDMIYGDSFLLDTEAWSWSTGSISQAGAGPKGQKSYGKQRVGHSAVLAPAQDWFQVLAFGGRLPGDLFANDFQSLSVPRKLVNLRNSTDK